MAWAPVPVVVRLLFLVGSSWARLLVVASWSCSYGGASSVSSVGSSWARLLVVASWSCSCGGVSSVSSVESS